MNKDQVIKKFCELSGTVMRKKFKCSIPADCFCGENNSTCGDFQFEQCIIDFIKEAINEKLDKEMKK